MNQPTKAVPQNYFPFAHTVIFSGAYNGFPEAADDRWIAWPEHKPSLGLILPQQIIVIVDFPVTSIELEWKYRKFGLQIKTFYFSCII